MTDQARIDANWRAITAELDAPRPTRVERGLRAVGIPSTATRLVVATPALRRAWFVSLSVAVVVGLGAAEPGRPESLFTLLVLAPLVPVLGVALAYGSSADPIHEVQVATPMSGLRVLTLRAVTVLAISIVVIGGLALLSPEVRPMAAAWLLPALAVTALTVAAMTWWAPRRAASLAGAMWVTGVVASRLIADEPLAAFGVVGQISALVVAAGAVATAFVGRARLERLGAV